MTTHPLVERYLERLKAGLSDLPAVERQEVVNEITNHITDATAAGKPIDSVLEALGPADVLARAYTVELLLHPRAPEAAPSRLDRFLRVAALIIVGSLPTFIIVVVLGTVGVSFLFSGIAVFVAGLVAPTAWWPVGADIDIDPRLALLIGPFLTLAGGLALFALTAYLKLAAKVVRRVLPRSTR